MSIREHKKDHRSLKTSEAGDSDSNPLMRPEFEDPLRYWTLHAEPMLVDLNPFKDGQTKSRGSGGTWAGAFTGRPQLIDEMAMAFRALTEYLSPGSIENYFAAMRAFWRMFDEIESDSDLRNPGGVRVTTIADISEVHRHRAGDMGIRSLLIRLFRRVLQLSRQIQKLPPLHWVGMPSEHAVRHLPPPDHIKQIRTELKHSWFKVIWRWERTDYLLRLGRPSSLDEARLRKNYRRYRLVAKRQQHPRPRCEALYGNVDRHAFAKRGYLVSDMIKGFYPDGDDIRAAFFLCLAATGWNVAVLLDLDVDDDFIVAHPKDPARYIMYGVKRRGINSEQVYEGLYKSQGSAGVVIETLIERTAPLRMLLRGELESLQKQYRSLQSTSNDPDELSILKEKIESLKHGVASPWLFVSASGKSEVNWLKSTDYRTGLLHVGQRRSYLDSVIERVNRGRPPGKRVEKLLPGDFRDAFAEYAYRTSGGMLLYVMKVLRHKRLSSTRSYVDNSFVNAESDRLYTMFGGNLWEEIKHTGRVDPAILAIRSRDGKVTKEQRRRLDEYRNLRRSRIGMGCRDPLNPPKRIAPDFVVDGKSFCPIHRCTLCYENAVVLPDSIDGLCKRLVELEHIQSNMSITAFFESSFPEEIDNTKIALQVFDEKEVAGRLQKWRKLVQSGAHRVIDLDGV